MERYEIKREIQKFLVANHYFQDDDGDEYYLIELGDEDKLIDLVEEICATPK